MNQLFDVAGMIVVLAIIATLVTSKQTAAVIKSVGGAFQGSIKAAKH